MSHNINNRTSSFGGKNRVLAVIKLASHHLQSREAAAASVSEVLTVSPV